MSLVQTGNVEDGRRQDQVKLEFSLINETLGKKKLKQQGSSQGSIEESSPCLSRGIEIF